MAIAAVLFLVACRGTSSSSSCALGDGGVLDVSHRGDGLYGVTDEKVGDEPLVQFAHMERTSDGVDQASGKRWLRVHLGDEDAHAIHDFTAHPEGRSLAVVVGGEVACRHKIRTKVIANDFQLSCCNPRACDRWQALLGHARGAGPESVLDGGPR